MKDKTCGKCTHFNKKEMKKFTQFAPCNFKGTETGKKHNMFYRTLMCDSSSACKFFKEKK